MARQSLPLGRQARACGRQGGAVHPDQPNGASRNGVPPIPRRHLQFLFEGRPLGPVADQPARVPSTGRLPALARQHDAGLTRAMKIVALACILWFAGQLLRGVLS
jgi:hypothetical protein